MSDPRLTALARGLPATVPFVGAEVQERQRGGPFRARLGANENAFGPSPRVVAAIAQAAPEVWMYGDSEAYDLRQALAAHHGIGPEHLVIGEGIDGLLGVLVRLIVGPGDAVVTSAGAYPTFNYHVTGFGGVLHQVPYVADHEDPASLLQKAREVGAKLIYLANPDNPMGTWHDADTIERMIDAVPEGCLLILDEAYAELAPADVAPPMRPSCENVIRMRTFSKAYGLAGARVGYAIGPAPLIKDFDKVRNHFGMGRLSLVAALAAIQDQAWLAHIQGEVAQARVHLAEIAVENGLRPVPSAANFLAIDCGQDGAYARAVLQGLLAQGIFVRMPFVAPQDRCIRVSCGPMAQRLAFSEALSRTLRA